MPDEVKALVNAGTYSLYAVKNPAVAGCAYVLTTDQQHFFRISDDGEMLGAVISINTIQLGELVTFAGLAASTRYKVNFA